MLRIKDLRQYLSNHEPNYGSGDIQSLTELLYWYYTECNPIDSGEIRTKFDKIYECTRNLSRKEENAIIDTANELCAEYERLAFAEGFHAGLRLMVEVQEWGREGMC